MTNIGFGSNIRVNWDTDSDDRWTVPVGLGFDTLVKLSPLPVKIGLEAYYCVKGNFLTFPETPNFTSPPA